MIYQFMADHADQFPLEKMSQVLGVSRSGYYRWLHRPPSARTLENARLQADMKRVWHASERRYGSPRIHQALLTEGWQVSRPRVMRWMRAMGIASQIRKQWVLTTDSTHAWPVAPNLLARQFHPTDLGAVWVSDLTYLRTADGWCYLTTVMDLADRQIIGWSFSQGLQARQTSVPAWEMARLRRPIHQPLIFHSDRGVQYACSEFTATLATHALVTQSMSRKGDCWDNAPAESFFKTLKAELLVDTTRLGYAQVRQVLFQFIELWYNRQRLHSTLDYRTPAAMEQHLTQKQAA